jgi:hypothetical protein
MRIAKINELFDSIAVITENLIQEYCEQNLGRVLTDEEMETMRYGCFWENGEVCDYIYAAIDASAREAIEICKKN